MERSLSKRELIGFKGRATVARAKVNNSSALTRSELDKAVVDMQRSIKVGGGRGIGPSEGGRGPWGEGGWHG